MATQPWVTASFLSNILKKQHKNNIDILRFSIEPLPIGDNFTSCSYKILMHCNNSCKNEEMSLFLKCCPESEVLLEYAKVMRLFENEIDMYDRVLPKIYSLGHVKQLSPLCLYVSLAPKSTVILEDLTRRGYKMGSRHDGLDLQHCRLVIEKLAYLHAASFTISKKESLTYYNQGIFWNNPYTVGLINIGIQTVIQTCEKYNHLNKYAQKLQSLESSLLKKSFAATSNKRSINVLNHGDCWVNNLMFSYDDNDTVKDVMLVDFQQSLYSSPAIDLNYFWVTSTNMEVTTNHLKYILDYYYTELCNNFKKLEVAENLPSRQEIEEDFIFYNIFGLTALLAIVPFMKSSKRPDANLKNYYEFDGKDSFRHDCFNNERYIERLSYFLPFYESFGIFN